MSAGATTGASLARPHAWHPATAPGLPPLLLLHGTGDDEHGLVPLGRALAPKAALLSPRGTVLEHGAPRFFRRLAVGVFDEDDLRARCEELAAFVVAASGAYGLPLGPLVAVGFSNGANTAAALLLTRPDLIAGAVLIGAVPPFAEPPGADLGGRRVLISNGLRDPYASPEQTLALRAQLHERGAEVQLLTHPGGHELVAEHLPAMRDLARGAARAGTEAPRTT